MATFRKERVGELLLSFLAEQVRELSDPRLGLVTLTAVKMSPDLKHANVYWSVLGDAEESPEQLQRKIREVEESFEKTKKLLKRRVAEELKLRFTPELVFHYDEVLARGLRIDNLLAKVHREQ